MRVQGFATLEEAMEGINQVTPGLNAWPEKVYDPKDPHADARGHIWVISVCMDLDADKLYLCTDGQMH